MEKLIYTELLKNIWNALYEPKNDVTQVVEEFFHPDYVQCINGLSINRSEYIDHVIEQKKSMTIETINYKYILEKGNELFAIYYPQGKNKENLPIEAEVIAYFSFKSKQIIKIHGQVRLIKGNLKDVDMKNS